MEVILSNIWIDFNLTQFTFWFLSAKQAILSNIWTDFNLTQLILWSTFDRIGTYNEPIWLPMDERVGCGTPCLLGSLGVREVVGSRLGRGNSKESCSSFQETGEVFSPEIPFYSRIIPNYKFGIT